MRYLLLVGLCLAVSGCVEQEVGEEGVDENGNKIIIVHEYGSYPGVYNRYNGYSDGYYPYATYSWGFGFGTGGGYYYNDGYYNNCNRGYYHGGHGHGGNHGGNHHGNKK